MTRTIPWGLRERSLMNSASASNKEVRMWMPFFLTMIKWLLQKPTLVPIWSQTVVLPAPDVHSDASISSAAAPLREPQFKDTYLQKCGWHGALFVASVLILLSILSSLPSLNFWWLSLTCPMFGLVPSFQWFGTDPSRLGGTSMVSYSIMTLLPQAFYYAPILLPFAIGNGMVAGRSRSCANLLHMLYFHQDHPKHL